MTAISGEFVFFHSARRVIHAEGALGKLAELAKSFGCARAVLAIDAVFANGPIEARAVEALKTGTGAAPAIVRVPSHEPDTASIEAAAKAFAAASPDMGVAVGGGSTKGKSRMSPIPIVFIWRIAPERPTRRISGSVKGGRAARSDSS